MKTTLATMIPSTLSFAADREPNPLHNGGSDLTCNLLRDVTACTINNYNLYGDTFSVVAEQRLFHRLINKKLMS